MNLRVCIAAVIAPDFVVDIIPVDMTGVCELLLWRSSGLRAPLLVDLLEDLMCHRVDGAYGNWPRK